jgi:hypothetical protein
VLDSDSGRTISCRERDKIILAFVLAVNEGNGAASDLEAATNELDRIDALRIIERAKGCSYQLRMEVLNHCLHHGC